MTKPSRAVPFRLTVMLPDGREFPVASIFFTREGRVTKLTTVSITGQPFGEYYDIEGDDLEQVTIWMQHQEP